MFTSVDRPPTTPSTARGSSNPSKQHVPGTNRLYAKTAHATGGLYIWEFLSTLDFEWEFAMGRRRYRWSIWVYSVGRLTTLLAIATNFILLDAQSQVNCQFWYTGTLVFMHVSFACASALVLLRVLAVWLWNRPVAVASIVIWMTNVGVLLHGIVTARSSWISGSGCSLHVGSQLAGREVINSVLATDIALLTLKLSGLWYFGRTHPHGVWSLLLRQGLIWLFFATLTEVPAVVRLELYVTL
ncbi:hypothetical protein BC834DRAFT_525283 [Gloeopeniophorella convolvens]|nr:hypothetical protein BC834DRAFT_525283 [Gloeopeniophorella convolvens]